MNVYVRKNEKKADDGLYHCYVTEDSSNRFLEHYEKRDTPDGSWRKCGDYYVGPDLFSKESAIKVMPHECVPSIAFETANMVIGIPSGNDHEEGGISVSRFVVDEPLPNKSGVYYVKQVTTND